jgi:protein transport protein SEC31
MSAIAWNPEGGLHIVTATDDDSRPVIRLWDLRNSSSYVSELKGHTKGISSLSWCPHDSGLLVSCGKDNKTFLWDMYNSCPVYEFGGAEIKR